MPPTSPQQRPDLLATLTATQDRVASRSQLARLGYDSDAVQRRIRNGRWQVVGAAVVMHDAHTSEQQQRWIAVLNAPKAALITGRAGASRFGLKGFAADAIDVLVPVNSRPTEVAGVRWRRCIGLDRVVVAQLRGPRIVLPPRAVIDAEIWTPVARVACGLVAAAVQQRVATASSLRAQLALCVVSRHHRILMAILADIEGGADSLAEIDFVVIARKAGLPPPIRQSIRFDSQGRRRYLDADFGTFVVEVDGGVHLQAQTYWDDAKRQNEIVLGGDRVLRFAALAIRLDEEGVLDQLRRAKAIFG